MFALHVDHIQEIIEVGEGRGVGDVVHHEEGVGAEIRRGPKASVFFLAGGVGQGEIVGSAIDLAGHGVGIFDGGVVSVVVLASLDYLSIHKRNYSLVRPLTPHQAQRD